MNPYLTLPKVPLLFGRQDFLIDISRDQRVLHLGCVDTGLLDERFAQGLLLHQKLAKVTKELWGFDIDGTGLDFLRGEGFQNLVEGDACYLDQCTELKGVEFDIILAGEVVEHLQNPGLFFQAVQQLMIPGHTKLVVSVPNAFRIDTLLWLLRGIEYVHPDHNYWFSYLTITNLFKKNNFEIEQVYMYSFHKSNLLPQRFQKYFRRQAATPATAVTPQRAATGAEVPLDSAAGSPTHGTLASYARALPRRLLAAFLYGRTPFWGDGLIVVAKSKAAAPSKETV